MVRRIHRWGAWIAAVPLFFIIATGILLQIKTWIPGIQPLSVQGTSNQPLIDFPKILEASKTVLQANVQSWKDIRTIDVRPSQGVARVRTQSNYEISIDLGSGHVLQSAYRRTQLLISLHEGTFFGDVGKYGIYFPAALLLLLLWGTGIVLAVKHMKRELRRIKGEKVDGAF